MTRVNVIELWVFVVMIELGCLPDGMVAFVLLVIIIPLKASFAHPGSATMVSVPVGPVFSVSTVPS